MSSDSSHAVAITRRLYARYVPVAWNGVAYALPRASVLFASLYVADRWGHESFARYSLAATTLMLAGNLVGASLGTAASKYVPEFAGGESQHVGRGFAAIAATGVLLAAALGMLVWAGAPVLAMAFGVEPPITALLRTAAVAVAACIVNGTAMGLLAGSGKFAQAAFANLGASVAFAAALLPLNAAVGLAGTLGALALFYAVCAMAGSLVVGRQVVDDWRASAKDQLVGRASTLVRYFVPMVVASGMVTPVTWICSVLLSHRSEPLIEVARFSAAYNWFAALSAVPAVLAQVEFVRMARARALGDNKGLARVLRGFVLQNLLFVGPVAAVGMALAGPLMSLFHIDDLQARLCLRLLLLAAVAASLGNPAGMFLAVIDRIWLASMLNVAWACVVVAGSWLMRDEGAVGVGVGFLVGYCAHFIAATLVARRVLANGFH